MTTDTFRSRASFGKRIEYWIVGEMLKEGLDVYLPLVDDMGIDAVVRRPDGTFAEVQVKALSKSVRLGDGGLFAAIRHEPRENYWFVFYSERMDKMWILSSKEFMRESTANKSGRNKGLRTISFHGYRTGEMREYVLPRAEQYVAKDFRRIGRHDDKQA